MIIIALLVATYVASIIFIRKRNKALSAQATAQRLLDLYGAF